MNIMKRIITFACLAAVAICLNAQLVDEPFEVNRELYRDYVPQPRYIAPWTASQMRVDASERPDHVNNAELEYYPAVFSQAGGSCGSASNEGYAFTYEMNSLLDRSAANDENVYPSHWIYLLAYQHSDREEIMQRNGIPSVAVYGGRTYSHVFGEQECRDEDSGRMQGYDKWLSAMYNRSLRSASFHGNLMTEEGRRDLKDWLWNHHGDPDFHAGGVACVGVAITGCTTARVRPSVNNRANGLNNKTYITSWGPNYDHSVTIVGYDDRVEFDLDGDGRYGEADEDEVGAWIICNSWGDGWADGGFVFCPYKLGYSVGTDQIPMTPGHWVLRKFYRPERVLRISMEYTHRAELQLVAGVSENQKATRPEKTIVMPMFNYDGNPGNTTPAPEIPMLGRWADGKLHTEPMEFGFDVTDLTAMVDKAKTLKYFLQINTASGSVGSGRVHELTLMNYENGRVDSVPGIRVGEETVEIAGRGRVTYVTVTVPGLGNFRPTAPVCKDGELTWKAPEQSPYELKRYLIYRGGVLADSVPATELSYTIPDAGWQEYLQVAAVYDNGEDSRLLSKLSDPTSPVVTITSTSASLSCPLDGTYLGYLRSLVSTRRLASLDLSGARIVEGGEPYYEDYITTNDEMGEALFTKCSRLKKIVLPTSITSVGKNAFSYCNSLDTIVVPDHVTRLGMDCFAYCNRLSVVTVGASVTDMAQGVFYNSPVKVAYVKPLTPPSLSNYVLSSNPVIHVYADALESYQSSGWARLGTLVGDLDKFLPRDTAVKPLTDDSLQPDAIYTLDGRCVKHPDTPGFYIVNGNKRYLK